MRLLRLLKLLKLQQHIDTLEDNLGADLGFLQVPLIATDCHLSALDLGADLGFLQVPLIAT